MCRDLSLATIIPTNTQPLVTPAFRPSPAGTRTRESLSSSTASPMTCPWCSRKEIPGFPTKTRRKFHAKWKQTSALPYKESSLLPTTRRSSSKTPRILGEVLAYLRENPALVIDVESHKMTYNGQAEADEEVTRMRAKTVVDWLEAHGVATGRLRPLGPWPEQANHRK